MQKFTLVVVFFIVSQLCVAQVKPVALPVNANHQIEYTENIAIANTSQSMLFTRALNWMVTSKAYKFKKLELMDNSFGRLMASGRFIYGVDEVFLAIIVDVKQNKAQIKVSSFDYNMMVGNVPIDNLTNNKTKEAKMLIPKVSESMKVFIKNFRDAMTATSSKI